MTNDNIWGASNILGKDKILQPPATGGQKCQHPSYEIVKCDVTGVSCFHCDHGEGT